MYTKMYTSRLLELLQYLSSPDTPLYISGNDKMISKTHKAEKILN